MELASAQSPLAVPPALQGYEDFVTETLTQYPKLRATRLHDMLVERGYKGVALR